MRWWKTAAVSTAVMFGVTGCGDAGTDDPSIVRMLDNRYMPADVEVTAGGSLEFVNDGRVDHNVIDVDGEFDSRDGGVGDHTPGEVVVAHLHGTRRPQHLLLTARHEEQLDG